MNPAPQRQAQITPTQKNSSRQENPASAVEQYYANMAKYESQKSTTTNLTQYHQIQPSSFQQPANNQQQFNKSPQPPITNPQQFNNSQQSPISSGQQGDNLQQPPILNQQQVNFFEILKCSEFNVKTTSF